MRGKSWSVLFGIVGISLLPIGVAESVPTITFDDEGLGEGIISYDGGETPAFTDPETPIIITRLSGNDTPFNDGDSFDCVGCILEFTTGSDVSNPIGDTEYQWVGDGSSFVITGCIEGLGICDFFLGVPVSDPEVLLEGTFDVASFDKIGDRWFFIGVGPDTKHPNIVDHFFGVDALPFSFGNTEIAAAADVPGANNSLGAFDADISQADVDNIEKVPEPGGVVLLLLGLGSLAAYRRRS